MAIVAFLLICFTVTVIACMKIYISESPYKIYIDRS